MEGFVYPPLRSHVAHVRPARFSRISAQRDQAAALVCSFFLVAHAGKRDLVRRSDHRPGYRPILDATAIALVGVTLLLVGLIWDVG